MKPLLLSLLLVTIAGAANAQVGISVQIGRPYYPAYPVRPHRVPVVVMPPPAVYVESPVVYAPGYYAPRPIYYSPGRGHSHYYGKKHYKHHHKSFHKHSHKHHR